MALKLKKRIKTLPHRRDWKQKNTGFMNLFLHEKFTEGTELLSKLQKINVEIVEDNSWHDTYWGMCRGFGLSMLGKLLMNIRDVSLGKFPQYSFTSAATLLSYELTKIYKYKPLPQGLNDLVRQEYSQLLPICFDTSGGCRRTIFTKAGQQLAIDYCGIVIGDYGAYLEFEDEKIIKGNIRIRPEESYRQESTELKSIKYLWYEPTDGCRVKIYKQLEEVSYAKYKPGFWYISPYELAYPMQKEDTASTMKLISEIKDRPDTVGLF